nr:unnamed protein product [Spirometra erinaceieuropaei]
MAPILVQRGPPGATWKYDRSVARIDYALHKWKMTGDGISRGIKPPFQNCNDPDSLGLESQNTQVVSDFLNEVIRLKARRTPLDGSSSSTGPSKMSSVQPARPVDGVYRMPNF